MDPDREHWPKCDICQQRQEEYAEYLRICRNNDEEPETGPPELRPIQWLLLMSDVQGETEEKWVCTQHLAIVAVQAGPLKHDRYDIAVAGYSLEKAGRDIIHSKKRAGYFHRPLTERRYDPSKGAPLKANGELNVAAWPQAWEGGNHEDHEE